MDEKTRPSAIVRALADEGPLKEFSTAEMLSLCIARLEAEIDDVSRQFVEPGEAGLIIREFRLAITAIEDGITRANKGVYRRKGMFAITDAERS